MSDNLCESHRLSYSYFTEVLLFENNRGDIAQGCMTPDPIIINLNCTLRYPYICLLRAWNFLTDSAMRRCRLCLSEGLRPARA